MRITVLASGSRGNATLLEGGGARVLVDAGYAPRTLRRRLVAARGRSPESLDAILITHAHGDHARYAEAVSRSFHAPLYATAATAGARCLEATLFRHGEPFSIGVLTVRPFEVPHDAPQVALVFDDGSERVGLATDLGVVPDGLVDHLAGCETLLLESNHDAAMLASGPYAPEVKARVAGSQGHLSNAQAGDLLGRLAPGLRTVVLMHLSETNNLPEIALARAREALDGRGVRLRAASQSEPLHFDTGPGGQIDLGFSGRRDCSGLPSPRSSGGRARSARRRRGRAGGACP